MKHKKKRKPNIPNIILTLISIAFLLIVVFKFNYNISGDMLEDPLLNQGQASQENAIKPEEETPKEERKRYYNYY